MTLSLPALSPEGAARAKPTGPGGAGSTPRPTGLGDVPGQGHRRSEGDDHVPRHGGTHDARRAEAPTGSFAGPFAALLAQGDGQVVDVAAHPFQEGESEAPPPTPSPTPSPGDSPSDDAGSAFDREVLLGQVGPAGLALQPPQPSSRPSASSPAHQGVLAASVRAGLVGRGERALVLPGDGTSADAASVSPRISSQPIGATSLASPLVPAGPSTVGQQDQGRSSASGPLGKPSAVLGGSPVASSVAVAGAGNGAVQALASNASGARAREAVLGGQPGDSRNSALVGAVSTPPIAPVGGAVERPTSGSVAALNSGLGSGPSLGATAALDVGQPVAHRGSPLNPAFAAPVSLGQPSSPQANPAVSQDGVIGERLRLAQASGSAQELPVQVASARAASTQAALAEARLAQTPAAQNPAVQPAHPGPETVAQPTFESVAPPASPAPALPAPALPAAAVQLPGPARALRAPSGLGESANGLAGLAGAASVGSNISAGASQSATHTAFGHFHTDSSAARALAPQIVTAIATGPVPGRFEIRLDPPELGTIEIKLDITDQTLRAVLSAERPATGELLRRHGEILLAQLREAGFEGVDLEFSRDQSDRQPGGRAEDDGSGLRRWGYPEDGAEGDNGDDNWAGRGPDGSHAAVDSQPGRSPLVLRSGIPGLDLKL